MTSAQSRREFLKSTAAIGVGAWIAGPNLALAARSPNEAINIASIGVGGKGSSDCDQAASAALAFSAIAWNAAGSVMARSDSTLRSTVMPDFDRPLIKTL